MKHLQSKVIYENHPYRVWAAHSILSHDLSPANLVYALLPEKKYSLMDLRHGVPAFDVKAAA